MFRYLVIDHDGAAADGAVCPSIAGPPWINILIRDAGELARRMPPWPANVVEKRKRQLPEPEPLSLEDVYALAMFAEGKLSGEMDGAGAQFIGEAAVLSLMILDPRHDRQHPPWLDELPNNLRAIKRRQIFASLALARLDAALGLLDDPAEQQHVLALIGSVAALTMRAGVGVFWQAADEVTRLSSGKSKAGSKRHQGSAKVKKLVLAEYQNRLEHYGPMRKEKAAVALAKKFIASCEEYGYVVLGADADREAILAGTIRDWLKGVLSAS